MSRVGDLVTAIEDGRPAPEIRRLMLRATARLEPGEAARLTDDLNAVLVLIDEAPKRGWPVELIRQKAVEVVWRIPD